jgi:hypothetical protein
MNIEKTKRVAKLGMSIGTSIFLTLRVSQMNLSTQF